MRQMGKLAAVGWHFCNIKRKTESFFKKFNFFNLRRNLRPLTLVDKLNKLNYFIF